MLSDINVNWENRPVVRPSNCTHCLLNSLLALMVCLLWTSSPGCSRSGFQKDAGGDSQEDSVNDAQVDSGGDGGDIGKPVQIQPLGAFDGRLIFSTPDQLFQARWNATEKKWSAPVAVLDSPGIARWMVTRAARGDSLHEVWAVLYELSAGTGLVLYRILPGEISEEWKTTSMTPAFSRRRGFDLEVEQSSGDLLAVYSDNTNTPVFRTFQNGSWSPEEALPLNENPDCQSANCKTNDGIVLWVELTPTLDSNEIGLVFADNKSNLVCMFWDGEDWKIASAKKLTDSLAVHPNSQLTSNGAFAASFESQSGDLLVAWADSPDGSHSFHYGVYNQAETSWSEVLTQPVGNLWNPTVLVTATDPYQDRVALSQHSGTHSNWGCQIWNGNSFTDNNRLEMSTTFWSSWSFGDQPLGVGWLGGSGTALFIYRDLDQESLGLDRATWSQTSRYTLQEDVPIQGKASTQSVQLATLPEQDLIIAAVADLEGKLYVGTYESDWTFDASLNPVAQSLSSELSPAFAVTLKRP